jgi:DNA-binding transcriptional LysR family regulator
VDDLSKRSGPGLPRFDPKHGKQRLHNCKPWVVTLAGEQFDWDDLRVLLAIARGGGLGAAARSLGVNHSSVYRRLDALEARLSVHLFDRDRGTYRLTPAGELLVDAAQRMEAEALGASRRVLGIDSKLAGVIRVSTSELLGLRLLPPLLRDFPRRYPDVEIELSIENRLVDLIQRHADVAIRATDRAPEHLVGRFVGKIASAVYASRAYLDRVGRGRSLAEYDWLALDDSAAHVPQARWLRENVPSARVQLRCSLLEGVRRAMLQDLGLGVLPCFAADGDARLDRITPPETSGDFGVWVLIHPDLRRNTRVRAFFNEISKRIAAQEAMLLGRGGGTK